MPMVTIGVIIGVLQNSAAVCQAEDQRLANREPL